MCTASIDFAHKNTCPLISERSLADGTLAAPFTSVGTSRWRLSNKTTPVADVRGRGARKHGMRKQ